MRQVTSTLATIMGTGWTMVTHVRFLGNPLEDWRSTVRRACKGAAMLFDPWTHRDVSAAVSRPELRPILDAAPFLRYKYLTDYLKTGLSRRARASILARHYNVLCNRANAQFFRTLVGDGVELWRRTADDQDYNIVLMFPHKTDAEGDLELVFRAGSYRLYALAFTLGPRSVVSVGTGDVMYIARVQGRGGALAQIRKATKDFLDISPAALLLAAAEGVAMELDLVRIIGISARTQLSVDRSRSGLVAGYDDFWTALGGEKLDADTYQLRVPLVEKPLSSIARSHRPRVRRKRAFKRLVREQIRARFRESLAGEVGTLSEVSAA